LFTYNTYNKGPKIEPCGTPMFMDLIEDAVLPEFTNCFRLITTHT